MKLSYNITGKTLVLSTLVLGMAGLVGCSDDEDTKSTSAAQSSGSSAHQAQDRRDFVTLEQACKDNAAQDNYIAKTKTASWTTKQKDKDGNEVEVLASPGLQPVVYLCGFDYGNVEMIPVADCRFTLVKGEGDKDVASDTAESCTALVLHNLRAIDNYSETVKNPEVINYGSVAFVYETEAQAQEALYFWRLKAGYDNYRDPVYNMQGMSFDRVNGMETFHILSSPTQLSELTGNKDAQGTVRIGQANMNWKSFELNKDGQELSGVISTYNHLIRTDASKPELIEQLGKRTDVAFRKEAILPKAPATAEVKEEAVKKAEVAAEPVKNRFSAVNKALEEKAAALKAAAEKAIENKGTEAEKAPEVKEATAPAAETPATPAEQPKTEGTAEAVAPVAAPAVEVASTPAAEEAPVSPEAGDSHKIVE